MNRHAHNHTSLTVGYQKPPMKAVIFSSGPPAVSYIPPGMGTWENSREPAYNATPAQIRSASKIAEATFAEIEAQERSASKPSHCSPPREFDDITAATHQERNLSPHDTLAQKALKNARGLLRDVEKVYHEKKSTFAEFESNLKQTPSKTSAVNLTSSRPLDKGPQENPPPPLPRKPLPQGGDSRLPPPGMSTTRDGSTSSDAIRPLKTRTESEFTDFLPRDRISTWERIDQERAERRSVSSEKLRMKLIASAVDFGKAAKAKCVQKRDTPAWKDGIGKFTKKR
ncbi:hypothetical protein K458DRAFT_384299 [Lentithecium fluviatile CBS 122367]|uniref:Uncharacterized protein n=1 Tax=Lentithecium fluviatile CBS 122367 TaxID=1168545 RepID=A0A6G1JGH5_9PLEO|nr:hypothetical protein K458DRAFT_384299 [Lentithecium fluviatile CBS 122367]